ncbi:MULTISPECIES: STAS domain-containing protein [unclassified Nonomuraea]|uniref:STAS domain-containing protein n=1 Tax=unclassified Nonomuraea TaxID=2593643 RepID=UPI0033C31C30
MALTLTLVHNDGVEARVSLAGDLDLTCSEWFQGALALLFFQQAPRIVVDVTGLRFCDVGGGRALASVEALMHGEGGELQIVGDGPAIRLLRMVAPSLAPEELAVADGSAPALAGGHAGEPAPPARRHLPTLRGLGPAGTRVRRPARAVVEAGSYAHPALRRAAELKAVTAQRLETLQRQGTTVCANAAEMHERLAVLHERLGTLHERRGGALPCDGSSHREMAEEFRRLRATFTPS